MYERPGPALPRHLPEAIAAALFAASVGAAPADSVSGFLERNGKRVELNALCAFEVPGGNRFLADRFILVMAADRPLDCAAAEAGFDPAAAIAEQMAAADGSWMALRIPDDVAEWHGERSSPDIDRGYPAGFNGSNTPLKLETRGPERVSGRWGTIEPETFFDERYEFALHFDAALRRGAFGGASLGNDGGAPGAALLEAVAAMAANDDEALPRLLAPDYLKAYRAGFNPVAAHGIAIHGGRQKGDMAALDVRGETADGMRFKGQMLMRQENGAWRLWQDMYLIE